MFRYLLPAVSGYLSLLMIQIANKIMQFYQHVKLVGDKELILPLVY